MELQHALNKGVVTVGDELGVQLLESGEWLEVGKKPAKPRRTKQTPEPVTEPVIGE